MNNRKYQRLMLSSVNKDGLGRNRVRRDYQDYQSAVGSLRNARKRNFAGSRRSAEETSQSGLFPRALL